MIGYILLMTFKQQVCSSILALMVLRIGVWVVVRRSRGGTTVIHQGNTSRGADKALFKHIESSDERIVRHYQEEDEFGKGQSVVTKDRTEGENFYTTIET